jgi:predicted ATP-grasp superfamily ATP-dependent carboligase
MGQAGQAAVSQPGRVLVLGDCRQTLTVVRSLGLAGLEVTLGTHQPRSSTGLSRHVADVWVYDNASPQRFCDHLEAFLRNERPDFVFTVGESQLRPLLKAAPRLEPLSTWVSPGFETVARCFDQPAMYQLVSSLGIGLVQGSAAEPEAALRRDCHVAAVDGRVIAYFQQETPSLRAHCEALAKALGYTGVGCIRFVVDGRSGSAAFLEFSPRTDRFALLAVQLAVYRKSRGAECPLPPHPVICAETPIFDWRDPLPTLHGLWLKLLSHPLCRRLPIAQPSA